MSIRAQRRRHRKLSITWRTLGWLLAREACVATLAGPRYRVGPDAYLRQHVMRLRLAQLRVIVRNAHRPAPVRREHPWSHH